MTHAGARLHGDLSRDPPRRVWQQRQNAEFPPGSVMRILIIPALSLSSADSTFWRESEPRWPRGPGTSYIPGMIKTPLGVAGDYSERDAPQSEIKRLLTRRSPDCHLRCVFKVRGCLWGFQLFILLRLAEEPVEVSPRSQRRRRWRRLWTGGFLLIWEPESSASAPTAAAEPQSTEANLIFSSACASSFQHDEVCTPEHGFEFTPKFFFCSEKMSVCGLSWLYCRVWAALMLRNDYMELPVKIRRSHSNTEFRVRC